MSILITGAGGMVGSHMVDYFYTQGIRTVGTYYKPTIDINEIMGKTELIECDVRYFNHVLNIILRYKPTEIFHLAAQSYPTVSWERPQETIETNVMGTANVFEAVKHIRQLDPAYDPMIVVACSSAEYGASLTPENVPIKEDTILLPLHPYGVSKVGQDLLAYQYYINDKIRTIRARIFNTTGPRKVNDVASDFIRRAVEIEKNNGQGKLRVGNLETRRAITDVRDLVEALVLLANKGCPGEVYNICGSKAYQIKEIIDIMSRYMNREFVIETDPALLRPTDEKIIFGDSSKLKRETGWEQKYTLERTIHDMIDYWRDKI